MANVRLYKVLVENIAGEIEQKFAGNAGSRNCGMVIDTMGWIKGLGYEVELLAALLYSSIMGGVKRSGFGRVYATPKRIRKVIIAIIKFPQETSTSILYPTSAMESWIIKLEQGVNIFLTAVVLRATASKSSWACNQNKVARNHGSCKSLFNPGEISDLIFFFPLFMNGV